MASDWNEIALGELAEIFDGPHATPKKTKSGPVFLRISNLVKGRIDLTEAEHLSEDDYVRWTRRVEPRAGDIVFSYETRLGEAARIPEGLRCCLGRRMGLLRPHAKNVDPRFLLYAYLGPQFQKTLHMRTVHGSTVDRIPLVDLPRFPVSIPADINEQSRIGFVLGALDDKIELHRRFNATLEAMARALFKSWFVDFGPVRARAEGRDSGLPKGFADLFPAHLVDSELGEIPEGWPQRRLNEVLVETNERVGKAEVPEYSSTNDGLQLRSERFIKKLSVSNATNKLIREGCLVFGLSRRVLNFGLMRDEIGSVSAAYKVFEVDKTSVRPDLLERMMRMRSNYFYNAVSASSREGQSVSSDGLGLLTFVQPSVAVQDAFYRLTQPLRSRMRVADREARTVAAVRDGLLPKLISGELRLKDPEKFIASAV